MPDVLYFEDLPAEVQRAMRDRVRLRLAALLVAGLVGATAALGATVLLCNSRASPWVKHALFVPILGLVWVSAGLATVSALPLAHTFGLFGRTRKLADQVYVLLRYESACLQEWPPRETNWDKLDTYVTTIQN